MEGNLSRFPRMPKRQKLTPFQHELLARERDQARIEHNRQVEQSVFLLAKESERNRKQRIALKQASVATLKQASDLQQASSKTTTGTLFRPQVGSSIRRRSQIRLGS